MNKTVIQILADHLRDAGYGGLVHPDSECGCQLGDLRPCAGDISDCRAGYKHTDPRPGREDVWLICVSPEPPSLGAFDMLGDWAMTQKSLGQVLYEALTKDAERYRWLRLMDWFNGPLSVLRDPQKFVTRPPLLGLDFPSRDRLDEAIDSAIKAKEEK